MINPYESPRGDLSKPRFDWWLAKRLAIAVAIVLAVFGVFSTLYLWQSQASIRENLEETTVDQLIRFLTGWDRPYSPPPAPAMPTK